MLHSRDWHLRVLYDRLQLPSSVQLLHRLDLLLLPNALDDLEEAADPKADDDLAPVGPALDLAALEEPQLVVAARYVVVEVEFILMLEREDKVEL